MSFHSSFNKMSKIPKLKESNWWEFIQIFSFLIYIYQRTSATEQCFSLPQKMTLFIYQYGLISKQSEGQYFVDNSQGHVFMGADPTVQCWICRHQLNTVFIDDDDDQNFSTSAGKKRLIWRKLSRYFYCVIFFIIFSSCF